MKTLHGKVEESSLGSGEKRPKCSGKHFLFGKRALAFVMSDRCHSKCSVSGKAFCFQTYQAAAGSRKPEHSHSGGCTVVPLNSSGRSPTAAASSARPITYSRETNKVLQRIWQDTFAQYSSGQVQRSVLCDAVLAPSASLLDQAREDRPHSLPLLPWLSHLFPIVEGESYFICS